MDVLYTPDAQERPPRKPWGLRAWLLPVGSIVEYQGELWQKVHTYDFWEVQTTWVMVNAEDMELP